MHRLNTEIGNRIRSFRKGRGMTLQQLADIIHKSKATVSKYEIGEIAIDVPTLYEIAHAFHVHVDELLPREEPETAASVIPSAIPPLFRDVSRVYSYYYDGRNGSLVRCVMDILSAETENRYRVVLYMNIQDYEHYHVCENTYYGTMEHYDVLTNIIVKNRDTPLEQLTISILASFLNSPQKWGLMFGVSSRPIMPIALKMLFSRTPLNEDRQLFTQLKISKEDIRLLKVYNMFSVM